MWVAGGGFGGQPPTQRRPRCEAGACPGGCFDRSVQWPGRPGGSLAHRCGGSGEGGDQGCGLKESPLHWGGSSGGMTTALAGALPNGGLCNVGGQAGALRRRRRGRRQRKRLRQRHSLAWQASGIGVHARAAEATRASASCEPGHWGSRDKNQNQSIEPSWGINSRPPEYCHGTALGVDPQAPGRSLGGYWNAPVR